MNLATKAKQSVYWNTGVSILMDVVQFGVMLILVRILRPEDYGAYGLIMAILGFAFVFSSQSFVDHLLQIRAEEVVDYDLHFTHSLLINTVLFIVFNIIVLALSGTWENTSVPLSLHILSLTLFLSTPHHLRSTMLKRELDWKRYRILHLIGFMCGGLVSIVLALSGFGVYSLLAGNFIVPLPYLYDLFIKERWVPHLKLDWGNYKTAWNFGMTRIGSMLSRNGRNLAESSLYVNQIGYGGYGLFTRGVSLAHLMCSKLPGQAISALYPVLTKLEPGSDRFIKAALMLLSFIAWVVLPIAVIGSELSFSLIKFVYGNKWLSVVPLMPPLLFLAFIGSMHEVIYNVLLANRDQKICFYLDITQSLIFIIFMFIFLPYGALAYIWSITAGLLFILLLSIIFLQIRVGIRWVRVVTVIGQPVLGVGIVYVLLDWFFVDIWNITGMIWVMLYATAFTTGYLLFMRIVFYKQLRLLVDYLPFSGRMKKLFYI